MELVINSFGTSLSREKEGFVVLHKDGKQRIPVVGIKSIQISRGAQITSDAVLLAIENEIEILFMDKVGKPIGRVWSPKYGSISTIRKGQLNFSLSTDSISWIKELIRDKIGNQQALLLTMLEDDEVIQRKFNRTVNRLEDYRKKIESIQGETIADIGSTLRGWEGIASKIYFEALNEILPEEYRFAKRSQHPAMDVVNALLNYGYGMLYGKIEGSLIKAGIDPYIGIFHRDDYNRPVLVYDVIEKYRLWVDYVVCTLLKQQIITDEFFSIKSDGSYWLEGLGRRILIQSFNDYLSEIIDIDNMKRSRLYQIDIYAQKLAKKFKNYE